MKFSVQFTLILLAILLSCCQPHYDSINFRKTTYSEIFEISRQEGKPVLLYFHFDACPACKKMEKLVFVNKEVLEFYNENFICYSINTLTEPGVEINKKYNVKLHPAFLYMNNDTVISHKITGFYNAYDFLIQGQNSLDPEKTLSRQKQLYSERKRDPDFLRNYVYSLSNADELDYQIVKEYLQTQTSGQLSKPHNIKFIYKYSVYQFSNYLQLSSEAYQYMVKNASSFEKYFPKDQVKTRVLWVAYSQAFDAANSQDKNLFDSSIVILSKYADGSKFLYKELDGRTTGALPTKYIVSKLKMYYYENSDDQILYLQTESEFIELIWEDGEALNSFAFDYQKKFSDQEKLEKAKLWIERSVELNRHYKNLDTYMSILYKLDYNSEAITIGKEAIQLAVRDSLDYGTTQILLDSFQSLLNK